MQEIKQVIRETTEWDHVNHDYILGPGGKMIGYRKAGGDEWEVFKKPLSFSKSGRKFIKLKEKPSVFVEPFTTPSSNTTNTLMDFF